MCVRVFEMNMCSISVEPIPSRMSSPVAARHSWSVRAGSRSPAETQKRIDAVSSVVPSATVSSSAR
jgi:hypothetical protein